MDGQLYILLTLNVDNECLCFNCVCMLGETKINKSDSEYKTNIMQWMFLDIFLKRYWGQQKKSPEMNCLFNFLCALIKNR